VESAWHLRIPDFSKPPLHTLPHDALLSTLKSLTNLRVVADAAATAGYELDILRSRSGPSSASALTVWISRPTCNIAKRSRAFLSLKLSIFRLISICDPSILRWTPAAQQAVSTLVRWSP
jgi:hypothetical protein